MDAGRGKGAVSGSLADPVAASGERFVDGRDMGRELFLQHAGRYLFADSYVSGKVVLDVACGSGFGSEMLARKAKEVTGVDISPEAVRYCQEHYQKANLRFKRMDCYALEFPDSSYDVVVSFETIEHLRDQTVFLGEIKRVLKPGGFLILSTPNRENFAIYAKGRKNPFHVKELDKNELVRLLSSFVELEEVLGQRYFSEKDRPLLAEYSHAPIPCGVDSISQRLVRVGLRTLFPEKVLSGWFLRLEVWANKCRVGDIVPDKAVYLVAVGRKS